MVGNNYDIFISYRREGGAQYARILQLMLIQRGYKVFPQILSYIYIIGWVGLKEHIDNKTKRTLLHFYLIN